MNNLLNKTNLLIRVNLKAFLLSLLTYSLFFIFNVNAFNYWVVVTVYSFSYILITPLKFFLTRPTSLIISLFGLLTFRYSLVIISNKDSFEFLNSSFNLLSLQIFFALISLILIDIFSYKYKFDKFTLPKYRISNNLNILIFILILTITIKIIPLLAEQVVLLINILLIYSLLLNRNESLNRNTYFIKQIIYLIIYYLLILFVNSDFIDLNFPLNRTTLFLPIYSLIMSYIAISINYENSIYNYSIFESFFSFLTNYRISKTTFLRTFLIISLLIFFYIITNSIKSYYAITFYKSTRITDEVYSTIDIISLGTNLIVNELTSLETIETFTTRLQNYSVPFISDKLRFASFLWMFSFLIPSFIFRNRKLLNISDILSSQTSDIVINYYEPFLFFFLEGSAILFLTYTVFIPIILINSLLFLAKKGFCASWLFLPLCLYSYFSYSYGFIRFALSPVIGSLIIFGLDGNLKNIFRSKRNIFYSKNN